MNSDFLALLKVMRWFYRDKDRWGYGEFDLHGVQYAYLIEPWESICLEKAAAHEGWHEDDWWDKAYDEVACRHELIVKTEYEPLGNVIFSRVLDGDAAWGMSVVIVHDRHRRRLVRQEALASLALSSTNPYGASPAAHGEPVEP